MNAATPAIDLAPSELAAAADDPQWYRDAVIYQLNVKAFFDSNGDGVGDFPGLTAKLDYVRDLGVNTLWLMPFYPSPLRDDGYDIAHYEDVHPQYGTLADFREMLDQAHRRGLRVITELVINHTSDAHPWFQAARQAPAGSPERDFYVWSDSDRKYAGTRIIFTDTETSNWTWDPVAKAYFWHRFFSHQPNLNYDNPKVLEAVIKTMRFWLDLGVDGFRLDAIPYLVERDGTSNENLPETHAVIRRLRAAIDAGHPHRFLLAEANMWPEDVREYFGQGDECHMAYHFPLMPRMYMAIAQEERDPIVEIMQQTPEIPDGCQWAIFLRNHDELTLEMVTSKERDYMYRMYAADPRARINLGIRRRLAPLMDNDRDRIKLMNSLLLSMPGSPIIYYGDEIGMGDNVFVGDRNGVRTPMQWSPDRNAGFSRADPQRLYLQPIMDAVYGYQALNVEAQANDASSLLNWTRRMLAVRKTSLAFGRGKRRFLRPGNRKILAYLSEHDGEALLFVANLARSAQPVELDLSRFKGRVPVEMLGRTAFPPIGELPYPLTIAAHGFYWFRLATDEAEPRWHQTPATLDDRPVLVLFDGWTSLFRDQVMPWRIGMAERIRAQFECETLPRHLAAQRWFAARGDALQRVRLTDHAVWTQDGASWLLAILTPDAAADDARYFLPLALAWEEHDDERLKGLAIGAVSKVRQQAQVGVMGDAFFDEPFCRALVQAIGRGETCATGHGQLRFRPTASFATVCGPDPARGPVGRPLSHGATTVVTIGDRLLLRAYHRLRPGINPELEVSCYLSEVARFPHCVPVAGTLEHVAGDGTVLSLALLQADVPNQGNGWAYTQAYLERHLEAWRSNPSGATADVHGGYLALMQTLGTRTAELHQALSRPAGNPAFGAEPATADDRSADLAGVMAGVRETFDLLATRLDALGPAARAQAITLLGQREALLVALQRAAADAGGTLKIRLHGDYGLSRVLLTRNDFVIIGFGGHRSRGIDSSRAKGSPLRDVAGMLHSIDHARWSALRRAVHTSDDLAQLAPLTLAWNRQVRQAFLAAYDAAAPEPAAAQARGWLGVFEVAHAIDQLRDELDQRGEGLRPALQAVLDLSARWSAPGATPDHPPE
ncbi:MAG: maltose alpha-D-glucosyltransferase [Aquabacterium sp.]|nr:maltose alpha-D-glucosyltransferase [Aquabacterium sp.]